MESTTDAAEWKLEVERVLPLLKVHIRTDNKVGIIVFTHFVCVVLIMCIVVGVDCLFYI